MNSWESAAIEQYPNNGFVDSQTALFYNGLYAPRGYNLMEILTAVCLRPNPRIDLGPVDDSCPLILCDMTLPDQPIVYASPAFTCMTGYTFDEIRGHNCRFLQAPGGQVHAGATRRYVEKETIRKMQKALEKRREIQLEVVNFKKDGQSFTNVLTMIPVMSERE
ncbi:putative vivid protein [Schizothecium vesticola]|uniref:Vivid protein n=1 Tax=Schizothecium vesticola TaxID=314040 RepID=A0AA40EPX0_9PEZI|nr:putative vivid protein [Schizothecium vesticola]